MDDLEKRLKNDAGQIRAQASPDLQRRLDAALVAAREAGIAEPRPRPALSSWWLSGLAGVAAAMLILLLMSGKQPELPVPADRDATVAATPPAEELLEAWPETRIPLLIENADLVRPLEQELADLQSDLEKARKNVERDVKNTL